MILQLDRISKSYPSGEQHPRVILDELDLDVQPGESLAIVGPSGSGKTTLLNLIGALDRPDSGKIIFEGRDLLKVPDTGLAAFRNLKIGFVFQLHHLLPQFSLWENVLVPTLTDKNLQGAETIRRAKTLIERVGLSKVMYQKPSQLSGGECQRAAVVRALVNRPSLLLADEPTGALDAHTASQLADLLVELNREEGIALITVTHSSELARKMQCVYELVDGKLIRH